MSITKVSPDVVNFDSALVVSPTLTIGDATAEDTKIVFDGNAQDYYIGLDDSADDLVIGLGSAVGTTPIISVDENSDVAIPNGAIAIGQSTFSGSSVLADFHGSGSGVGAQLAFANDHNTDKFYVGLEGNTTGDAFLYQQEDADINFYTNNTFRAKLDNSGNLGIGTASPSTSLDIVRAGVQPLRIESSNGTEVAINMVNTGGNVQLEAHSGNFNIDADSVGIGTTSPEEQLDLSDTYPSNLKIGIRGYLGQAYSTAATILGHSVKAKTTGTDAGAMVVTETNSGGGAPSAIKMESGIITFHTEGSGTADAIFDEEGMRLDASGVLTLGGSQQAKMFITSSDRFNLATSDGLGIQLDKDNNRVAPVDASGSYNNNVSLGSSSLPFKDLHIGRIFFGGDTAAANALHDYEEGTWTASGSGTSFSQSMTGRYVKIGAMVHFTVYSGNQTLSSSTGTATITGLPFTPEAYYTPVSFAHYNCFSDTDVNGYVQSGATAIYITNEGAVSVVSYTNGSGKYFMVSGCYTTAS